MGNTHSADFGRAFKEKEMKNRFIGDTRIPSFKDGSSTIDLSNYSETVMPEYRGFKFLYITVMDISQYTITSDFYKELAQWGIRYDDGNEDAKQEMQDSYVRLDWDVEQGPHHHSLRHKRMVRLQRVTQSMVAAAFVVQLSVVSSLFPSQCMRQMKNFLMKKYTSAV